jgi:hypothetical protein
MTDGLYALIGVLVGTVATAGPQFWDRFRSRKRVEEQRQADAFAALLDALWGRLILNIAELEHTPEERRNSHTSWISARNGFNAISLRGSFGFTAWLDLELTDADHKASLSWHNANIKQGLLMQNAKAWVDGEPITRGRIVTRSADLRAKYWTHSHAPERTAADPIDTGK